MLLPISVVHYCVVGYEFGWFLLAPGCSDIEVLQFLQSERIGLGCVNNTKGF